MTLKVCSCCKKPLTTFNVKSLGQCEGLLYFNCLECNSTNVLSSKKRNLELDHAMEIYRMAMEDNAKLGEKKAS